MNTDTNKLWTEVLADLEKQVSRANFLTLFRHTALLSLENNQAIIAAPSTMVIDLLERRFSAEIKKIIDKHTASNVTISFVPKVIPEKKEKTKENSAPLFSDIGAKSEHLVPTIGHLPRVRADFTFANMAVSTSNELAFVSATTVAKNIGRSYNPFFIYGPVGVGKTHLMHAIANDVYQKMPDKKIIYITSEEFTNEVVDAIRTNDTSKMKKRFRTAFVLLIDDVQFLEGKDKVQEELFHTFNILIDNGSQICLSSDRPPQEIKKLEKRLSSRFAGGLTVDIESPDFELKTAILQKKSEKFGYDLPIDVAKTIAENAKDTRSLEGLLLRVITEATTMSLPISLSMAQKALGKQIEEKRGYIRSDDVIDSVCSFYRVKQTQLKGPKREASLVRARQVTMYLLKHELGLTYAEIGNQLGGRDHTTIMHGVEKMEALMLEKQSVSEDILGITASLHG